MRAARALWPALLLVAASCVSPAGADLSVAVDPEARAALLDAPGCGVASRTTGSGVLVDDGLVLTVAHLVARSDGVSVSVAGRDAVEGKVTALDLERDLALVRVPGVRASPVELALITEGATGQIVGGATSGTLAFEIQGKLGITTEEILGNEMHRRLGYELAAAATTGDSGAGAYDEDDRLVGILFATHETEPTSWITAAEEIEDFLDTHGETTEALECDPDESRLR